MPARRQYAAQAIEYAQRRRTVAARARTLSLADEISTPFRHGQPLVQTFLSEEGLRMFVLIDPDGNLLR